MLKPNISPYPLPSHPPQVLWQGKAIHISDGDAITVLTSDKQQAKIRLYWNDAPEMGLSSAGMPKTFASGMVGNWCDVHEFPVEFLEDRCTGKRGSRCAHAPERGGPERVRPRVASSRYCTYDYGT
jgi:hypothetical protein